MDDKTSNDLYLKKKKHDFSAVLQWILDRESTTYHQYEAAISDILFYSLLL